MNEDGLKAKAREMAEILFEQEPVPGIELAGVGHYLSVQLELGAANWRSASRVSTPK